MSSVRLYILGALAEEGPMHGHQLRLLAEQERVHYWTDISVGSLYGVIKRLSTEGLITELRLERSATIPSARSTRSRRPGAARSPRCGATD